MKYITHHLIILLWLGNNFVNSRIKPQVAGSSPARRVMFGESVIVGYIIAGIMCVLFFHFIITGGNDGEQ